MTPPMYIIDRVPCNRSIESTGMDRWPHVEYVDDDPVPVREDVAFPLCKIQYRRHVDD